MKNLTVILLFLIFKSTMGLIHDDHGEAEINTIEVGGSTVITIPIHLVPYRPDEHKGHMVLSKIMTWEKEAENRIYPTHWIDTRMGVIEINKDAGETMVLISGVNKLTNQLELIMDIEMDGSLENDSIIEVQNGKEITVWYPDHLSRSVQGAKSGTLPLKLSSINAKSLNYNIPILAVGEFEWNDNAFEIQIMSAYSIHSTFKATTVLLKNKHFGHEGGLMEKLLKIGNDVFTILEIDTQQGFVKLKKEPSNNTQIHPQIGFYAPLFKDDTIYPQEASIALENYRGKYVWINFWATWCAPCLSHMDEMKALRETFGSELHIISVNVGGSERKRIDHVLNVIQIRNYDWAHLMSESIAQTYNVIHLPTSFLIDPEGMIVSVDESPPELVKRLKK